MKAHPNFLRVTACLAASLSFPFAAYGAATYTTEDNGATLVVTVDADGAMLDDAQVVAGVTTIAKRGPGTLASTPLASYEGDFSIESGVLSVSAEGDLGETDFANTVYVRDGASIRLAIAQKKVLFSNKSLVLSGNKASGANGKIVTASSVWYDIGNNMTITLQDDATIYTEDSSRCRFNNSTFDLGGNVLTFQSDSWKMMQINGCTFRNGGKVVVASNTTLMTDGGNAIVFDGTGALELAGNCVFRPSRNVSAAGWTLYATNANCTVACNNSTEQPTRTDRVVWDGPMVLARDVKLANYTGSTTVLNLKGPVSGTGTIAGGPGWINLHSADNTYAGAVTITGKGGSLSPGSGGIGIWNGATCFPSASSITLADSARLEFMDDAAGTVGTLTFTGNDDQSIRGGAATNRATLAGFSKSGTGVLTVDSPVHVTGRASVTGGTLRIPQRSRLASSGLREYSVGQVAGDATQAWGMGMSAFDPADATCQATLNAEDRGLNGDGPEKSCNPSSSVWGSKPDDSYSKWGFWYHGYIWNHTDAPVTWRIGSTVYYGTYVTFTGETTQSFYFPDDETSGTGAFAPVEEVTLQPGATQIDIVTFTGWTKAGYRWRNQKEIKLPLSYCTDTSWPVAGVDCAYAATNSTLKNLFQPLVNSTDALGRPLFTETATLSGPAVMDDQPVFDDLAFANGAALDLGNNYGFRVKNLTGSPAVANAHALEITNQWTILSADFPAADASVRNPMTVDGTLSFAEGATFRIDDESRIARDDGLVVATATGGVANAPAPVEGSKFLLVASGNSLLLRSGVQTTVLIFR